MKFTSRDNATVARPDSTRRRRNALRLQPTMKLGCEALEVRITPTVSTWTGAGLTPNWSDLNNWSGSVAPVAGNNLDFPIGELQLTNYNDLTAGTSFSSITIDAGGYDLTGNAIALTGGIASTYTSNLSTIELPTALGGTLFVSEADGSELDFTNAGVISGSGSLVESGPGTLYISTASTYTGSTTVLDGTLVVAGSIASSSGTSVQSGGTLGGPGAVGAVTSTGGTVGINSDPIGFVTTGTTLSLDAASTFVATVNGTAIGGPNGHSLYVVEGPLVLNGATLSTTNFYPYSPTPGDSIDLIINATSITGTFNGLPEGGSVTVAGQPFTITYQGGEGGHDVVLNFVQSTTTTVTSSANPSTLGESVTLNATVTAGVGTPTGSVSFFDGATLLGSGSLSAGVATLTTTALPLGVDSITAVYGGDANDTGSTSSALSQTVSQAATTSVVTATPNPSVFGQSATLSVTVSPVAPGAGTPTGSVSFSDGATFLGYGTLSGGIATLTSSVLSVGEHSITVIYDGDADFIGDISPAATQTVNQAATTSVVTATPNPSVFGQSATFSVTVSPVAPGAGTPTGMVSFFDGATFLGTGTLSGGIATLTSSVLSVGEHSITAVYGGDANDSGSTSTAFLQEVDQATTSTTLSVTPDPSAHGQTKVLTATVTSDGGTPTGIVSFFEGATLLGTAMLDGSGIGILSTANLRTGPGTISAVYNGDANNNGSSSAAPITVFPDITSTQLSSPTPSTFGQSISLTATVTPDFGGIPTGTMAYFDGATLLGITLLDVTGTATFSDANLAVGSHSITAVYSGDVNDGGSTSFATQTVIQAATTSVVTATPNPSVFGQSATLSVTVSPVAPGAGTPTGTMSFFDGATLLGTGSLVGGVATLTSSVLSVGEHSITAVYEGDADFTGDTSPAATQVVSQISTATSVTAAPSPSIFGHSVTITASISPVAPGVLSPSGSVQFFSGSTLLGSAPLSLGEGVSTAQFSTSALAVGTDQIRVVFAGDATFIGSTGQVNETVNQAATTVLLTTPQSVQTFGQAIAITAQVDVSGQASGSAIGTLTFSEGSTVLAVLPASGGAATYAPTGLAAGAHVITVTYSGDTDFIGSSAQMTQTVVAASTYTTLTTSAQVAIYGQSITYSASAFSIAPAVGVPTGTIAFYDGSALIGSSVLVAGQASLTVTATAVGSPHDIHAVYTPDSANFLTNTTGDLHDAVIKSNSTVLFYYQATPSGVGFPTTVLATTPGAGVPTGTLTYYVNGRAVGSQQLVNGQAGVFVPRKFAVGKTFSVAYSGDANFNPSVSKAVKITPALLNGGSSPIQVFRARAARTVRPGHHA